MKNNLAKYKFFNLPRQMVVSDYEELCDLAVERLKNSPGVKSIYLSGGKWVPGISDLDIILIFDDNVREEKNISTPKMLSEKAKFIFLHSYGSYNEKYFSNLCYLAPDKNKKDWVKLLWGKPIAFRYPDEELDANDYKFLNAILIFDLLINKLLLYPKEMFLQKINVRGRMGFLYSLTYTLEMAELLNGNKLGQDFYSRIKKLKQDWFNNNEKENLRELVSLSKMGQEVIMDVIEELNNFVIDNKLPQKRDLVFKNRKFYITFEEEWSRDRFMQNFRKGFISVKNPLSGRVVENFKFVLPTGLSFFLLAYASQRGTMSDWIKRGFFNYDGYLSGPGCGISKHIKITNEFVDDTAKLNGLYGIPFPYGYLAKKQRLVSKLGDWLVILARKFKK